MNIQEAFLLLSIIRLIIPLTIIKWPLFGILASIFIDIQDFNYLPLSQEAHYETYQIWDKVFDTYYLAIAAYVSLSWKDKLATKISVFSFLYRLLGVLIFPLFANRSLLIFFPNFFEGFFIFYILFVKLTKKQILFTSRLSTLLIIVSLLIPAIVREYFMHVIKTPPWEVYRITPFGFDISYWSWILILLSLPFSIFIWQVKKSKS